MDNRGWITWTVSKVGVALCVMILMVLMMIIYLYVSGINSADSANQAAERFAAVLTDTYAGPSGMQTGYVLPDRIEKKDYVLEIIDNRTEGRQGIVIKIPAGSRGTMQGGAPLTAPMKTYPEPVKDVGEGNTSLLIRNEGDGVSIYKVDGCSGCVSVKELHYDAGGPHNSDCEEAYINDEYVIFENACKQPVDLSGWTVRDLVESRPAYTFQYIVMDAGETLYLHTGSGTDGGGHIYWNSQGYTCNAVWNNEGDTLQMGDSEGNTCLKHTYTTP